MLAWFLRLIRPNDAIFYDELVDNISGAKLSGAKLIPFKHNDYLDLEVQLKTIKGFEVGFIITESLFYGRW